MEEVKNLIFVSIISADNDKYPEDVKQEILQRYHERRDDWEYVLQPLGEDAKSYIELLNYIKEESE